MNIKYILTIILSLTIISQVSSQEITYKKNALILSPLSTLRTYNPSFQMAYQRKFNQFFSIILAYDLVTKYSVSNLIFHLSPDITHAPDTHEGHRFSVEFRTQNDRSKKGRGKYRGLEILYNQTTSNINANFDTGRRAFLFGFRIGELKQITHKKKDFGVFYKFGRILDFGKNKNFFLDYYLGFGLNFRFSTQSNNHEEQRLLIFWDEMLLGGGNRIVLGIPMNLKFGYRF